MFSERVGHFLDFFNLIQFGQLSLYIKEYHNVLLKKDFCVLFENDIQTLSHWWKKADSVN